MKKLLAAMLVLMVVWGCAGAVATETESDAALASCNVQEGIAVTGYTWLANSNNRYYVGLVITNTNDRDVDVEVSVVFFDDNRAPVGAENGSVDALGSNETSLLLLSNDAEFTDYDYTVITDGNSLYTPFLSDIICESTVVKNKVFLTITNNGTKEIKGLRRYILFLKDGEVLSHSFTFLLDGDKALKPQATIYDEEWGGDDFNEVLVFFEGRAR